MNKKILPIVSILAIAALAGCNKHNSSSSIDDTSIQDSSNDDSTSVSIDDKEYFLTVDRRESFDAWTAAKSADPSTISGFYDREQPYKVGDDNEFRVQPKITVIDEDMNIKTGASNWRPGFEIKVIDGEGHEVGDNIYTVTDEIELKIQFKEAAIGNSYKVKVVPNGLDADDTTANTEEITVSVIDGYNVYDAIELGLMDTRENVSDSTHAHYDFDNLYMNWKGLLESRGVKTKDEKGNWIEPSCMVLQDNFKVTTNDVPSAMFYSKSEAASAGVASLEGTMKDWAQLYLRTENPWYNGEEALPKENSKTLTVEGNYYKLDFSEIPLVARDADDDMITPISHAGVFYLQEGNLNLNNINITGNAPKQEDAKYGGGLIFCKGCSRAYDINIYNTLNRSSFICYMSSESSNGYDPVNFKLQYVKCSDSWNSFLYNWAGTMDIKDSYFNGCGGPIIIQDHHYSGSDTNYDVDEDGVEVKGIAPKTVFTDCVLENYVNGSEGWFESFGATSTVGLVKSLTAAFNKFGYTFVYEKDAPHNPTLYSTQGSLLNFITVNKCAENQGMTNYAVSGEVQIINTNDGITEKFNYARYTAEERLAMGTKVQTYTQHLMTLQGAQTQENAMAVIQDCLAEGIEVDMTAILSGDMTAMINEVTRVAMLLQNLVIHWSVELSAHKQLIRGGNAQGAPVFQTGTSYGIITDASNPTINVINNAEGNLAPCSISDDFASQANNHVALYYNGMMIVMGLSQLPPQD